MKHILLSAALWAAVVAAFGCKRPQAAPAEPLLTQEQARQALWDLPEVAQWADGVRKRRAVPVCMDAPPPEGAAPAAPVKEWVFELSESAGARRFIWNRFRVDAATGDISVWDEVTESYLTITVWRIKTGRE